MSRGRPKTDIAEILRRQIWYHNVVRLSGMSDYELDGEFDLITNRSGKHRRRFFERLRCFNEMPFRGRTLEFVELVDSHSKLNGTARLYTSTFWKLASAKALGVEDLRLLIIDGFRKLGLLNAPNSKILKKNSETDVLAAFLAEGNLTNFNNRAYIEAFNSVFADIGISFDTLAITGALYREAYFATNLRIALFLESAFSNQLESIVESIWMPKEIRNDFYTLASERILRVSNAPLTLPVEYLELFNESENKESGAGCFLATHEELMGW